MMVITMNQIPCLQVSVGTLKDVNGLYGDDIYVGDTLIIPRQ